MPEDASRFLARVSRAAMVDSWTSRSRPISVVVRPTTKRRVRATRSSGAIAGWQQAKISRSCSSATWAPGSTTAAAAARISSSTTIRGSFFRWTASERRRSSTRRRAAVSSHAPVFVGTPSTGQCRAAASKASETASSARSGRANWPMSRPISRDQWACQASARASSDDGHATGRTSNVPDRRQRVEDHVEVRRVEHLDAGQRRRGPVERPVAQCAVLHRGRRVHGAQCDAGGQHRGPEREDDEPHDAVSASAPFTGTPSSNRSVGRISTVSPLRTSADTASVSASSVVRATR